MEEEDNSFASVKIPEMLEKCKSKATIDMSSKSNAEIKKPDTSHTTLASKSKCSVTASKANIPISSKTDLAANSHPPRTASAPGVGNTTDDLAEACRKQRTTQPCREPDRCKGKLKDLIGKHKSKNAELERREECLYQRLQMLEASMPAVMVWKTWPRGGPDALRRFVDEAAAGKACKVTPSRHYDCRVREAEKRRKEAHRRAEEARCLWLEREAALEGQRARLELARQQQEERKERIERLAAEARKLKEAREGNGCPETCEGAEGGGGGSELIGALCPNGSTASLGSGDLECLGRLEALAAAECRMKERIAELELKEEAYMRALARADELCAARQDNNDDNNDCDKLRCQLQECQAELDKYKSKEQSDKDTEARPSTLERGEQATPKPGNDESCGPDEAHTTMDQASGLFLVTKDKDTSSRIDTSEKICEAKPDCVPACEGPCSLESNNRGIIARPKMRSQRSQAESNCTDRGTDSEYFEGVCCTDSFCCNDISDMITTGPLPSETGSRKLGKDIIKGQDSCKSLKEKSFTTSICSQPSKKLVSSSKSNVSRATDKSQSLKFSPSRIPADVRSVKSILKQDTKSCASSVKSVKSFATESKKSAKLPVKSKASVTDLSKSQTNTQCEKRSASHIGQKSLLEAKKSKETIHTTVSMQKVKSGSILKEPTESHCSVRTDKEKSVVIVPSMADTEVKSKKSTGTVATRTTSARSVSKSPSRQEKSLTIQGSKAETEVKSVDLAAVTASKSKSMLSKKTEAEVAGQTSSSVVPSAKEEEVEKKKEEEEMKEKSESEVGKVPGITFSLVSIASEYHECCCELPSGLVIEIPERSTEDLICAKVSKDKTNLLKGHTDTTKELCICEPLTRILAKYRQQMRLACGCPRDRLRNQASRGNERTGRRCPRPEDLAKRLRALERKHREQRAHCAGEPVPCDPHKCSRKNDCCLRSNNHSKRDQGVLAKLPKSRSSRRSACNVVAPERILAAISSAEIVRRPNRRKTVGPSCTCLEGCCKCGDSDC